MRLHHPKPYVRPWALATPVAVLLICLPLLRPLRHPDPALVSDDETARLDTIAAIVEHHTLSIDSAPIIPLRSAIQSGARLYSSQMPMLAALLAAPYWVMYRMGYRMDRNLALVPFILTLIGATLPAALTAGAGYRMGRMFELRRPWRTALAATMVFASGLISYAVVINAHAPAAALITAAAGCLVHVAANKTPSRCGGWLVITGLCAALAAAIDLPALVFLPLLAVVVACLRLSPSLRVGGVLLYLIGTLPVLALHAILTVPITGDLLPGFLHPSLAPPLRPAMMSAPSYSEDELDAVPASTGDRVERDIIRLFSALFGEHGLLTHFPVILVGYIGMAAVMHRHWPASTKALATATFFGALVVVTVFAAGSAEFRWAMFANRWLIVFLPLTVFWIGAWLRKPHRPSSWWIAAALLAFSTIVSLIGATDPFPREGYDHYTVFAAAHRLAAGDAVLPAVADR